MSRSPISLEHRGPMSVAVVTASHRQLDAFRNALLREEFILRAQTTPHRMEFYRKARVLKDDWPMTLSIEFNGPQPEIRCSMFIPWSWISIFAMLVMLFLPFASASGVPPLLLLGLGVAVVIFAIVKQKFDLSPDAFWQGRPRKRWNEILERLLTDTFA